jgi:hypothetical protein
VFDTGSDKESVIRSLHLWCDKYRRVINADTLSSPPHTRPVQCHITFFTFLKPLCGLVDVDLDENADVILALFQKLNVFTEEKLANSLMFFVLSRALSLDFLFETK